MKSFCFEKQFIERQYSDKWKFTDYNALIKKLQCSQILSLCEYPVPTELNVYDVPISTCKFSNKYTDILAVADENGVVCIQNVKRVKNRVFKQTHTNTVYDIAWMPGNSQFLTVSGDNSAKLWDYAESDVSLISVFIGHKRSVRCVSFKPENTAVFATGSRDGAIMIWDTRAQKKCTRFAHQQPDQIIPLGAGSAKCGSKKPGLSLDFLNCNSVTGLVFQSDNTLISCASLDNSIKVWDMRKTYSRSATNSVAKYQLCSSYPGFSYLCMNTMRTKLYASCMDSYIYCFNINSYDPEPVAAFYGHENGSFYVKSSISFDGTYLMSGSSDERAYIWNTRGAELSVNAVKPFVALSSHSAEVTCVEMSPDNLVVVTCSDDGTFRLWDSIIRERNKRECIDEAACCDVENIFTVKTQWKNKRKFQELEEDIGPKQLKNGKDSPHSKICRFYNVNLSSTCICHNKCTQTKGTKRLNDETSAGEEPSKKMAFFASSTSVDQKQPNITLPKHPQSPIKLSLKRKLEDMPNFAEDNSKNKKINCGKILTRSNSAENNDKNKSVSDAVEVFKKYQKSCSENRQKENRFSSAERKDCSSFLIGISSPTSNLPNYIEDGTSPYLHRCSRMVQKENNWLTNLQEKRKKVQILEQTKGNPDVLPSFGQKKKIRSVDHTLHKYFKVTSKATEKNYNLQEIQKKNLLVK